MLLLTEAVDGHAIPALPEVKGKKVTTGSVPKTQLLLYAGTSRKVMNLADFHLHTGSDHDERRPRERLRFGRKKNISLHDVQVYLFPNFSKSDDQEAGTLRSVREHSSSLLIPQYKALNLANFLSLPSALQYPLIMAIYPAGLLLHDTHARCQAPHLESETGESEEEEAREKVVKGQISSGLEGKRTWPWCSSPTSPGWRASMASVCWMITGC